MTYEEFKHMVETNAIDDTWFFSHGWDLVKQYPEYSNRLVVENACRRKRHAQTQEIAQ